MFGIELTVVTCLSVRSCAIDHANCSYFYVIDVGCVCSGDSAKAEAKASVFGSLGLFRGQLRAVHGSLVPASRVDRADTERTPIVWYRHVDPF